MLCVCVCVVFVCVDGCLASARQQRPQTKALATDKNSNKKSNNYQLYLQLPQTVGGREWVEESMLMGSDVANL